MLKQYFRTITPLDTAISPIGLGTVKFGRNQDVKYPKNFELPSDKNIQDLLGQAQDLGINLIDTAPAYGTSEARLGKLITHREDWIISTKVGEQYSKGLSRFDFSTEGMKRSIYNSLKQLKTDWIDIVLIHSHGDDLSILNETEAVETLQKFKSSGYIRAIGFSGKSAQGGLTALRDFDMDIAMLAYNPLYEAESPIIDYAHANQKSTLIKKALSSGHIKKLGKNPIQHAMNFAFHAPISSVILGTVNPSHLVENCQAAALALATTKPCSP